MFGLLNVDKPAGLTSRDVVNRIQRRVRPVKIGHAGTLDPLATGVLVVCLGPATRLIDYVQQLRKCYRGTFLLGRESDTEDIEGQVVELPSPPQPTRADLERALAPFTGEIQQRPPAFSALKLGGQRAYDLARKGRHVELAPRPVMVYRLELRAYEYPEFQLDIECGSGTYVRSLGRDIAQSLGTAAVMSALQRTAIGSFRLAEAVSLERLETESLEPLLISPLMAVADLPQETLDDADLHRIANGQFLNRADWDPPTGEIAVTDRFRVLRAILERHGRGLWKAKLNFSRPEL